MPVQVIDTIKPKNNGNFPIVEAADVAITDDLRLDVAIDNKADKTALAETNEIVATKANAADVNTSVSDLQGQINQIVISASSESIVAPEVAASRVDVEGNEFTTLKERLDSDENKSNVIRTDLSNYYMFDNKYSKTFSVVAGTAHSSNLDRLDVDIAAGDTIVISLKNDMLSEANASLFATNKSNVSSSICTLKLNSTITIAAEDDYISIGLYVGSLATSGNVTYNVEVIKDGQKKALQLVKSEMTEGSLQTSSMRVSASDSAFCYLHKVPLGPYQQLKVFVPEVDGVYYKYRYGRYKSDEVYYDQIASTESDTITQANVGYYVSVGIYAYNTSDDSPHSNILSEYTDEDIFRFEYLNEYENRFIPLDRLPIVINSAKAIVEINSDIDGIENNITDIKNEIAAARTFCEIDYSDHVTEGYYSSATTGQAIEAASNAFAQIPCETGDKFIVDFGGSESATPLFAAGSDGKSVEIFVASGEHPAEPVEVTISNGVYLTINYKKIKAPLVKRYQLGNDTGSDGTAMGLNKEFKNYAVQAMRPINLSGNAYLTNTQPLSLMHFSDIHGDAVELTRMKEFYETYKRYFDDAICTGDLVELRFISDFDYWNWNNVLLVMGNHDVLDDPTGWDWSIRASQEAQYEKYFNGKIENWDCEYEEDKTYYYKDYTAKKIRLIVLNCMLTSTDNENQLSWFESILDDAITQDLAVVVANHYPVRNFTKINTNFTSIDKSFGNEAAVNMDAYQNTIEGFKQNGGAFICWIAGHTHFDLIGYNSDYPSQYCICIDALNRTQGNQYSDVQRTNGTKSQDLANMFVVDTTSSIVKLIRIGADKDHYLRSKKSITLNYATGAVITSD